MTQLERQDYKCYGCFSQFHDNQTVPPSVPILCNACTTILDLAANDQLTLRRISASLDYQSSKHNVYLIGSLKNPDIILIANELRKGPNFDVHDEWITPGPPADDNWQAYETARGRDWASAMRSRGCQNIFNFDRAYMDHADSVVLVMPAGKSSMCELGYAAGINKNTIIHMNGKVPDRYEVMPNFANHIVNTTEELITKLKEHHVY
jgi:hypothetical protein